MDGHDLVMAGMAGNTAGPINVLPAGWEQLFDEGTQQPFFINHNDGTTTWVDPRDKSQKKAEFADCGLDELPYGWQRAFDSAVGEYYIDHNTRKTYLPEEMRTHFRQQNQRLQSLILSQEASIAQHRDEVNAQRARLSRAEEELQRVRMSDAGERDRVNRIRAELERLEDTGTSQEERLAALQTEYSTLFRPSQPFELKLARPGSRIDELEIIQRLSDKQLRESQALERRIAAERTTLELAAQTTPREEHEANERRAELAWSVARNELDQQHLQEMADLKKQLSAARRTASAPSGDDRDADAAAAAAAAAVAAQSQAAVTTLQLQLDDLKLENNALHDELIRLEDRKLGLEERLDALIAQEDTRSCGDAAAAAADLLRLKQDHGLELQAAREALQDTLVAKADSDVAARLHLNELATARDSLNAATAEKDRLQLFLNQLTRAFHEQQRLLHASHAKLGRESEQKLVLRERERMVAQSRLRDVRSREAATAQQVQMLEGQLHESQQAHKASRDKQHAQLVDLLNQQRRFTEMFEDPLRHGAAPAAKPPHPLQRRGSVSEIAAGVRNGHTLEEALDRRRRKSMDAATLRRRSSRKDSLALSPSS